MRKFSFFLVSLLCLCASTAWGYTGSNPLSSSGQYYIYHPSSGKFLSSQANTGTGRMKAILTPELWTINYNTTNNGIATVNMYHTINSTDYYFNLAKNGTSANPNISTYNGKTYETTQLSLSSTNTGLVACKIHRTANPARYLNYNGSNFTGAETAGDQNDWVFITPDNYPAFIEELRQVCLPSASGWTKITSMPSNPEQYYYCLVDNFSKVMLSLQTGSNNGSGNKAAFYKSFTDPLTDGSFLWEFETATTNTGYYTIKNVGFPDRYMYSPDGSEFLFYTNSEQTTETSHHTFLIEYTDGSWTITNSDYLEGSNEGPDAKHIGLWTPANGYEDGQELAANKKTADAGHFQIYAIRKDVQLFNPDFSGNPWSFGWSGTGSNKASAFVNQSNNGNFTGTFAEMWKNNKLEADGDIYQSVSLPAGYYKLKAKVVSSNIYSTLYAKVGNTEYNDWFTGSGTSAGRAIVFYVPSTTSVRVGYKTRNHDSSASSDTWVAVDDFALTKAAKLNLTVSSNLGSDAIFVDDVKTSAFTFTYDDTDFTPPSPSSSSSSSDFYYTITTNTISSITDGSNDVITYDPATNKITAVNAGTATITFHQNLTSTINAYEVSYNVTVNKIPNPITVTLGGEERNSKNIRFSTDVTFTYSALNGGEVTITKRNGGAGATTLANDNSKFTSSAATEGVDYWDLSIAETYKYEGSSTFVRIQVNAIPEEESYLYTGYSSDHSISKDGNIEITLSYSPLEIRYQAMRNNFFSIINAVCTSYNANNDKLKEETTDGLDTDFGSKTHALPEETRKIVLSRTNGTGTPIVKDIYVVRRTYVNATVDKANLGEVLVSNTETATITVNWGTSNGGNITVESDNTHFTVSSSSIAVTDNSNGTANITVTYTPVAGTLGTEQAIITLHDRYHTATVNLQATAINNKTLVNGYGFMYNSSHKIKIDDTGTKVYEALYTSGTQTVTLHELSPVSSNLIIPAGKVVLLYKAEYDEENPVIHYEYSTADNAYVLNVDAANCFKRISYSANVVNYVLAKKNDEVAFYRYTGDATNLNVLQLPNESGLQAPSMIRIVTEDNTATALVPVYEENSAAAGQKVNSKKIFIDGHLYIQQGNNLYDALGRKVQ